MARRGLTSAASIRAALSRVGLFCALVSLACGGGATVDAGRDGGIIDLGDADTGSDAADAAMPDADAAVGHCSPWTSSHRVHAHTRLWKVLAGTPEFGLEVQGLSELGATSFSRHVKTGAEDPWWPSAVPVVEGAPALEDEPDLVQPIALRAEAADMPFLAYYWHLADARLAALHPEWVCRDLDGAATDSGRGEQLDLTGPYGAVLGQRLRELGERGARGVFLDSHHMPETGCFGTELEAAYLATGGERPSTAAASDPAHRRYLDHQAAALEEAFGRLRAEVCPAHDGFAFLLSAWTLPALYPSHTRATLLAQADSAKTEWRHPLREDWSGGAFGADLIAPSDTARLTFAWALLRDAAHGPRTFHVYAPGFPNEAHARGFVAATTAFGGVPILDVAETLILEDTGAGATKTTRPDLTAAMQFGQRISAAMAGAVPERWAAVHFAEAARDARPSAEAAWREVLWPAVGAADALASRGVPVAVLDDSSLDDAGLRDLEVLVLPTPSELTMAQAEAVARFEARGRTVLRDVATLPWGEAGEDAASLFLASIERLLAEAAIALVDPSEDVRLVAHRTPAGSLLLAIVNGVAWVQPHGSRLPVPADELRPAPLPASSRIELLGDFTTATQLVGGATLSLTTGAGRSVLDVSELQDLTIVALR